MGERPVFEGRIDLVRGQFVLERNDDPSVLAEFRDRGALPVKLSTGRPRTGSQSRSRPSQPLLASSVPAGWKAALKPPLVVAFEGRLPDAGGGVPEVDLAIVARRRQRGAVGAPGDAVRRQRAAGSTGRAGPYSASRIRQVGFLGSLSMTAIWAPSGRKARSPSAGPRQRRLA